MKKVILSFTLFGVILTISIFSNSCQKGNNVDPTDTNTVTDIDVNVYHTIAIGTQVWMAENLRTTWYINEENIKTTHNPEADSTCESNPKYHQFEVKTADFDIEVMGTKFNVKAYFDENSVSTTLFQGSLEISSQYDNIRIKPNQKLAIG